MLPFDASMRVSWSQLVTSERVGATKPATGAMAVRKTDGSTKKRQPSSRLLTESFCARRGPAMSEGMSRGEAPPNIPPRSGQLANRPFCSSGREPTTKADGVQPDLCAEPFASAKRKE